jgi:hypothetical protein
MPRKYVPKRAPIRTLVRDSGPAGLEEQGRMALLTFLLREFGDTVSDTALRNLHRDCLLATSEASVAITTRRGSRPARNSKRRVGASRREVNVYAYVLLHRLRAALTEAGIKHSGLWGIAQARTGGGSEGLAYRLARECAQLAGVPLPQNLDRIRQGSARIVRESFELPSRPRISAE